MSRQSKAEIAAQIAALQAELAEQDGGVYEDPQTGRWFIVMHPARRSKTTTRRRAPDGSQLFSRDQALIAKGQWEARMAGGAVAIGRERFEQYWPRYLRHAKGDMSRAPGRTCAPTAPSGCCRTSPACRWARSWWRSYATGAP